MTTVEQSQHAFGSYMATVLEDQTKLKQFVGSVTDSDSLRAFAAARGYQMSAAEADGIYAKARALLNASSGQAPLNDELLEGVTGGISYAAIGAAIGGLGAAGALTMAVGFVLAAPTGGGSLAAAAAIVGLWPAAAASLAVGAAAAGAVGAGIGAAGGYIVEHHS